MDLRVVQTLRTSSLRRLLATGHVTLAHRVAIGGLNGRNLIYRSIDQP